MTRTLHLTEVALLGLAFISLPAVVEGLGTRPSLRGVATTVRPTAAETVPMGASELVGALRRMRVYLFQAPAGSDAFGAAVLGPGRQVWFLLPSCHVAAADDTHAPCSVDHVELDVVHGASLQGTAPQIVMDGEVSRRVQAFALPPQTENVRVRLVGPTGDARYEAVFRAAEVREVEPAAGHRTPNGFDFEFALYPAH